MPSNVLNRGLKSYIEGFENELLTTELVATITETLQSHDQEMNKKQVAKEHVKQLRSK